jgi:hypothetical protein
MVGKRLELLRDAVPGFSRVGVPDYASYNPPRGTEGLNGCQMQTILKP